MNDKDLETAADSTSEKDSFNPKPLHRGYSHWVSDTRAICLAVELEEWMPGACGAVCGVAARVPSAVQQKANFHASFKCVIGVAEPCRRQREQCGQPRAQ